MLSKISVVIIARNAQNTIAKTLDSLGKFDEVILYLNNSTDNTQEIATNYKNTKIIHGDFKGFGPTKNIAASFAKNSWVLSLDSDEVILPKLEEEISLLDLQEQNSLYIIKRDNYFLGKKVKYSGWGKDFLARLYNKKSHAFNQNSVHEFIAPHKSTKKIVLQNSFKHNAVTDINQFLEKVIKYSDLASQNKKTCTFLVVLAKSYFAFFKTYILQLGFLDGWRGFVIAVSNANGKFFRYTKRYINC